jgi:Domain of unknown function (DUF4390)
MVFITDCLKKCIDTAAPTVLTVCMWVLLGLFVMQPSQTAAQTPADESTAAAPFKTPAFKNVRINKDESGWLFSAQLQFSLSAAVLDALDKGVPIHFLAEAEVMRDRWYWYDKKVLGKQRAYRLVYQPLMRRWRLSIAQDGANSTANNLVQNFETLEDALRSIGSIGRWKIAELDDVKADADHYVNLRFKLDTTQLPRPFQIGALTQSDWDLSIKHTQRMAP